MPTCDPSVIPVIIRRVMELRPQSILDVGVGMGKWGLLFREYLEGWGYERYSPEMWRLKLDGFEIWKPYLQAWHLKIYDSIFIQDVRKWREEKEMLPTYDLIYFGDVIEHMPKKDGWTLLKDLPYKVLILSTPNFQTRVHRGKENPHQDHVSRWQAEDFRTLKHKVLLNSRMLVVEVQK